MYTRLFFAFIIILVIFSNPAVGSAAVFTNPATITINDAGAATPYPSTINVSGLTGNITQVRVTLAGFSHAYPEDVDILLVGPQGQKVLLMSDAGDNGVTGSAVTSLTLIFDDNAASNLPEFARLESGTFKPGDYEGFGDDNFPAPAPASPYSTALSAFNNTNPNGTWQLYVRDDFADASGQISGGWSLDISVNSAAFSDLRVSQQSQPQVQAGQNLTYLLQVANNGPDNAPIAFLTNTLPANTVFQSLSAPEGWVCQLPAVGTSGTVSCSMANLANGATANFTLQVKITTATPIDTIISNQPSVATSGNDPNLANNTGQLDSVVVSGQVFTASAAITLPDNTIATSYPATLTVSGRPGNISSLKIRLLRLSHTFPEDLDVLLVGPQGQKVLLMSDTGDNGLTNSSVSNLVLVFADSASSFLPERQRLSSGVYKPSNYSGAGNDIFPAPAPGAPYSADLSIFSGTNPNGVWSLYVRDDASSGSGVLAAGWSLDIFSSDCTAPFVVTETGDNGSCGTLSKAINEANRSIAPVTISFSNLSSISLDSPLPLVNNVNGQPITLDGFCQFQLSGRGEPTVALQPATGVVITSGLQIGSNVTLQGLAFYGFSNFGVEVLGTQNQLSCNWLGRPDSTTGAANSVGLRFAPGSANNRLGEPGQTFSGNLIAGNTGAGWQLAMTSGNKSYYTWLGLDRNGNFFPNGAPTLKILLGSVILFLEGNRLRGG